MLDLKKLSFCIMALVLTGCASKSSQQLYQWDNYQDSLYKYYTNASSPQEQIVALQGLADKARISNKPVPPGLHAQLGMLYNNIGEKNLAIAEFNAEKQQYPESAAYIDFLVGKDKGDLK